jgi:hypothetical protein
MAEFLDEVSGGFVVHTRASSAIDAIVSGRIYPDVAPQDTVAAHIIYTQVAGHRIKTHGGRTADRMLTVHVYAICPSQAAANNLAKLLETYWLAADYAMAAGATIKVCNGGVYETGQWFPKDSSDEHMFFSRLVLTMLVAD